MKYNTQKSKVISSKGVISDISANFKSFQDIPPFRLLGSPLPSLKSHPRIQINRINFVTVL